MLSGLKMFEIRENYNSKQSSGLFSKGTAPSVPEGSELTTYAWTWNQHCSLKTIQLQTDWYLCMVWVQQAFLNV